MTVKELAKILFHAEQNVYGEYDDPESERIARLVDGEKYADCLVYPKNEKRLNVEECERIIEECFVHAVEGEKKVILIAGGYDKNIPFDDLGPEVCKRVKTLVLTGMTAEKIRAAVLEAAKDGAEAPKIIMIEDFYEAVRAAAAEAQEGDAVILSPAGAAFDKFKNFAVRGKEFKKTVMAL